MTTEHSVHRSWAEALTKDRLAADLLELGNNVRHYGENGADQRAALLREAAWRTKASGPFDFHTETEIGVTYTPWTDGWAVGFKVTGPNQPDRYILLNPSNTDSIGEANCFVYVEARDVSQEGLVPESPVCYINVYRPELFTKDDRVNTYCLYCEESVQTDGDQVPRLVETFDELLDNFGRVNEDPLPSHVHAIYHEAVA